MLSSLEALEVADAAIASHVQPRKFKVRKLNGRGAAVAAESETRSTKSTCPNATQSSQNQGVSQHDTSASHPSKTISDGSLFIAEACKQQVSGNLEEGSIEEPTAIASDAAMTGNRCLNETEEIIDYMHRGTESATIARCISPTESEEAFPDVIEQQRCSQVTGKKHELKRGLPRGRREEYPEVQKIHVDRSVDDTAWNPSRVTMKDILRSAEAKERKKQKEEVASKILIKESTNHQNTRAHSERGNTTHFAPQVQIINGQIVINEKSLTLESNAATKDNIESYTRVEETCSKLNYHSFMKRTPAQRWSPEETELFYQAVRQFGTDFELITRLFPKKTRRQVKAKYKKEEREHPLRMSDAWAHRSKDFGKYEEIISILQTRDEEDYDYGIHWDADQFSSAKETVEVCDDGTGGTLRNEQPVENLTVADLGDSKDDDLEGLTTDNILEYSPKNGDADSDLEIEAVPTNPFFNYNHL